MVPKIINLKEKFECFSEHWNPKILTELNGQVVKAAKLKGDFIWHSHALEDELFYVISGELDIEFREATVRLKAGEMITIPRGVEHRPRAKEEVLVLLFEPSTTLNTGDKVDEQFTRSDLDQL